MSEVPTCEYTHIYSSCSCTHERGRNEEGKRTEKVRQSMEFSVFLMYHVRSLRMISPPPLSLLERPLIDVEILDNSVLGRLAFPHGDLRDQLPAVSTQLRISTVAF